MYNQNVINYRIRSNLSDPDFHIMCYQQKPKVKPFLLSSVTKMASTVSQLSLVSKASNKFTYSYSL